MQKKINHIYKVFMAFLLMTMGGSIGLVLRALSLGFLTDFNRKYLMPVVCKCILATSNIKMIADLGKLNVKSPHFITFNHNSFLDGFVLMALGLTQTRFLLSEKMLHYLPLTLCSLSIGVLFIPQQHHQRRRLRFFKNLEKRIQREKISYAGAAEGVHNHFHGICTFNKGVFHTAMNLKIPIATLFIYTPMESNPYNDFRLFKPGTVKVELMDIISTENWELDNLEEHINAIRNNFVSRFNELNEQKTQ
jgi:1-acyl-sn-glycerol-3-phosphate acyltransferase